MDQTMTPTMVVARRMRDTRKKRGWTAQRLAEEMTKVGVPWERLVVAKLETGRRKSVSVDELLALALVLNVAPVHLLVPLDDDARYQVTPSHDAHVITVRNWIRGVSPLSPGQSQRDFLAEIPEGEFVQVTRRESDDGR